LEALDCKLLLHNQCVQQHEFGDVIKQATCHLSRAIDEALFAGVAEDAGRCVMAVDAAATSVVIHNIMCRGTHNIDR
jgi:hypothetical protein